MRDRGRLGRRCRARTRCLLGQDRPLELLQLRARVEAELVGQVPAGVLVGLERRALASVGVQRKHQQAPQPLPARLLRDETAQLGDGLPAGALADPHLVQLLDRLEPQLLEPVGLAPGERLGRDITQGGARPVRQGRLERRAGVLPGARCGCLPSLAQTTLEARDIELVIGDRQPVTGRGGGQSARLGAECVAEPGDVDLHGLDGAERLLIGPQAVGQQVGRDRPIALEQQQREHAPLADAAEVERLPVGEDRDLPQKTEFELHVGSRARPPSRGPRVSRRSLSPCRPSDDATRRLTERARPDRQNFHRGIVMTARPASRAQTGVDSHPYASAHENPAAAWATTRHNVPRVQLLPFYAPEAGRWAGAVRAERALA